MKRVLGTPGRPLERTVQHTMQTRFSADFSRVRVHTDAAAAKTAIGLGAAAFTVGEHIVFAPDRYSPATAEGRKVLAHELAHVLQQTPLDPAATAPLRISQPADSSEREADAAADRALSGQPGTPAVAPDRTPVLQRLTSQHGQHAEQGVVSLTSDLSSPVVEGTRVSYRAEYQGDAGDLPRFEFTLTNRDTGEVIWKVTRSKPDIWFRLNGAGRRYRMTCKITSNAGTLGTVALDHDTTPRDPRIPHPMTKFSPDEQAAEELMADLRGCVLEAATATGEDGLPALVLASVLRHEMANTTLAPIGSPREARESELAETGLALHRRELGKPTEAKDLDRSVGVGQVKLSTAAMVTGAIPWTEQAPADRGPGRGKVQADFMKLTPAQQREILTLLSWPRGNISVAARFLTRLKNRPNRYPKMSRNDFGSNERAVKIIATEYNLGPSTSPESLARPSSYGDEVWKHMQDPLMRQFFPG
ncbi:eCIS core domain-containing protein [Streptomyces sp. NPDC002004]